VLSQQTQSWLDDLFEYARLLAGAIFAYAAFRLMRWIGMNVQFVNILETIDQIAAILIVTAYLGTLVRRAFVKFRNG
jgi:hypothetical protein